MSVANTLAGYDPGFATDWLNYWEPGPYTAPLVSTGFSGPFSGEYSMDITSDTGGTSSAIFSYLIPVIPGAIINPSIWMYASIANQYGQFSLVWYGDDEETIAGVTNCGLTLLVPGTWTQVSAIGNQAPDNAYWYQLQVLIENNNSNTTVYVSDIEAGWGNYATNMCANPSFEQDLTGWLPAQEDETLTQIDSVNYPGTQINTNLDTNYYTRTLYGYCSMEVITPGLVQNEGCIGPASWMPATTNGSMSCNIYGETGTIAIQCVDQITGEVQATQVVVLDGADWVNPCISDLTFVAGHAYYMQIITYGPAQDITFVVDGVMYEPEPQVPVYVDGSQYGCFWSGTTAESASFQPYQFGITATCAFTMSGVANVINPGETFPVEAEALEFYITFGQPVPMIVISPSAAMTDFGIWQGGALGTDLDPAMAYSTWNNQNVMNGQIEYNRAYMSVCPPLDQFTSTGGYNWKRAAYMAVGFQWLNTTNNAVEILTDVQTEMLPVNEFSALTPRAFQSPRQLQTIVKPDRLNYVSNPSFESGTGNWSTMGSDQVLGISSNVPVIPALAYPPGIQSMTVTPSSDNAVGVEITIPYLIPGRTYMCSMWIQPDGSMLGDVSATCGTGTGTITGSTETGYGSGGYGAGPYGGILTPASSLTNTWQQLYFSFEATTDSEVLEIQPVLVASPAYPFTWFIDAVLIEDGDILNGYFDGNFGPDALWLDGGTVNLCQSFYYNQLEFARHIITDALANNTPLGISYAQPLYAHMPTQ